MSKKDTAQFWDTAHRYLDHQLKVIRQVSSHTIDSYRDCLNNFINYLEWIENVGRKKISFHNFEKETIKRYQTWMIMEQGLAPKICNLRLTAIRAFLEYAAQETCGSCQFTRMHAPLLGSRQRIMPLSILNLMK